MAYSDYVEGTQLDLSGVVVVFCNTFITWYFPVVSPFISYSGDCRPFPIADQDCNEGNIGAL